ncbi:6933_t:CDS:2, partial [Funneliformis geosporum]
SVQILINDEVGKTYKVVKMAISSVSVDEGELRSNVALKVIDRYSELNCKLEALVKLAEYE